MESNSQSKRINANAVEDRISSLSDEIISHILSFLPTKYAVATSVLSKRWRYLWTNVTNLLFDYYFPGFDYDNIESFDNFVDKVLHQCTSKQFQRFYLRNYDAKSYRVKAWINEAIRRNVRELELYLSDVPSCVFTCKTLTVLELHGNASSRCEIPTSFCLPCLRILFIDFIYLSNSLIEKLIHSCPVLEDLSIRAYEVREDSNFIIYAPLLKRLKCNLYGYINKISTIKVLINAPNLEYMDIYDVNMADYEVENLSSIAEANMDIRRAFTSDRPITNRAVELLRGLSGVKSLSLGYMTMWTLGHTYQHHLPILHNMTQLKFMSFQCDGQKILPRLLEVSPKLKVLIWKKMDTSLGTAKLEGASDWSEPQILPECLSSCLEVVEFEGFEGNGFELKLVKYLLEHAAFLKKLIITRMAPETNVNFFHKVLESPRRSRTCQILTFH